MKQLVKDTIYKNKDLAEWFGISETSFKNQKTKKLESLKDFCDYIILKGGKIKVLEVFEPEYTKEVKGVYPEVRDNFDECRDEYDTCKNIAEKIEHTVSLPVTSRTIYNNTRKARDELYGRPFSGSGTRGSCEYVWAKRDMDGSIKPFTEEELKIKNEIYKKYFSSTQEKEIIIQDMVEKGELKSEEAWAYLDQITDISNLLMNYRAEIEERLNIMLIRVTHFNKSAFEGE